MSKKQIRLLLIEDNPGDARLIQELLSEEFYYSYTITIAESIREVQSLKVNNEFDLILLDLTLPDSSGLDTIISVTDIYDSTPIVVLTGHHDVTLWNTAMQMGVEDYFEKGNLGSKDCFLSTIRFSIERFNYRTRFEKSQLRFEKLIAETLDGIVVTDLNGTIKYANPPAQKIFQKTHIELINTPFKLPLVEGYATEHILSTDNQDPVSVEIRGVGTEWEDQPAKLFMLRDITLSIKARKELSNAYDILNRSKAVLIKWRNVPGFPIEFVSENVETICGYNVDEFKKGLVDWISITHPEDVDHLEEALSKRSETESTGFTIEYRILTKNDEIRWVQNNTKALLDLSGKISHYESVMIDITDQKKAEERLNETNQRLNKEIKTRDRIFSIIAHDLIGGYSPLIGLTDVLMESADELSDDEKEKIYTTLNEAFNRNFELLKNLLDWGRAQGNRLVFKPVSLILVHTLDNVKSFLNAAMQFKAITLDLRIDEQMTVVADRNMLETIFRNLISNAIKFSPEKSTIEVFVETDNLNTIFAVKDHGVGMTESQKENLFISGISETTLGTNNEKGNGLGLQLCVEFVQKHGGKIWAKSSPGIGTTIFFTIPNKLNQ